MKPQTIPEATEQIFQKYNHRTAFVDSQAFYRQTWTYNQVQDRRNRMAAYLQSKQLVAGDRVAICAPNSPWWITVYLACAQLGIVIVPLDFNSTGDFIDAVLKDTATKVLFKSVYKVYDGSLPTVLLEDMAHLLPNDTVNTRWPAVTPDQVLEIVYTSGSTGTPKGVVLTHGNVMSNVSNFLASWPANLLHQTNLSLVPLSHMLEQTAGFWAPFSSGYTTVYIASLRPTAIIKALQEEAITSIITVPAFLQLLRRRIQAQLDSSTLANKTVKLLLQTASHMPRPLARLMTTPVRRKLGKNLHTIAVGGAALPAEIEDFWVGLGYYVIQGYGLTEASPLATYSTRRQRKLRSVGKGLSGQELRLTTEGELLLRGPNIFSGYYKNQAANAAILDADGWLHSGDIAEIDSDGFVFLKGRLKNMLLSSNGLNIYPEDIEAKILNFDVIKDVVVLMDNHSDEPRLTAVVLTDSDDTAIRKVITVVNQTLASHQTIQKHIIWPDSDFPRTPTRKIRRPLVQQAVDSRRADTPFVPSLDSNVIHDILRQVSSITSPITDDQLLASNLGIDSLKRLELVTLIEEKLLVAVDETDITQTTTVGELSKLVDTKRRDVHSWTSTKTHPLTTNRLALFWQSIVMTGVLSYIKHFQRLETAVRISTNDPVLYVANHTSHLDALTFMRLAGFSGRQRLVVAAAADYFFTNRFKSWISRNILHAIPVERDGAVRRSLEQIGAELSCGRSVVIFPEGSRSQNGQLNDFKPGIGLLAATLQVPVVPVKLNGNFQILPKGTSRLKRGKLRVTIGQPQYYSVAQTPEEITADLQRQMAAL